VHADYEAQPGGLLARRASIPELRNCLEFLLLRQKDLDGENISSQEARIWEAQWIARRLFQLKESAAPVWDKALQCYRPFEFRDAAVLFRATTQLPLYESEFKKAGLPYLTISGRGFYNRQEVQDLIAMLSALANPLDDLSLAACLRSPLFSLSDETLYRLRWRTSENHLSQEPIPLKNALSNPPFSEQRDLVSRANKVLETLWSFVDWVDVWQLLRTALDLTGFEIVLIQNDGENGRQRANVHKFLSLARGQGGASISAFLSRLRDLQALEAREGEALGSEPESGAVQLMSIHAAKGLEFPVLVVADLGRGKRHDNRSSYLLHDPAFGLVCKVRDEWGEWQEPASYAWGKWLDQKMEEAERKRLLYVACTRAADLLILTGQVGSGDSWLQQILNAYEIDPDGPEDELCQHDSFGVRIFRPVQLEEILPVERLENSSDHCLDTLPILARPLPLQLASVSTAVTHLERPRRLGDTENFKIHPAVWIDSNLSETGRAPRCLIGEIVHRALANWNCLSYSNYELTQYLERLAHRYAIDSQALAHAVSSSFNMLDRLKRHQLYAALQSAAEQYRELPFTLATDQGTLHGVIDLLYQDAQGGWHVLDWKTEWTPEKEMTDHAQEHLLQMAIYALAVEKQLGIMPDVSLCFLSPRVLEYKVDHDMIKEELSRFSEQIRK
jgi:ATP-dependent helicase/nuclease subunit A